MNWFYIDESIQEGDRRQGPVSFEDLHDLLNQQKINDSTLVWHKGLSGWITWKEALEQQAKEELVTTERTAEDERMLKETVEAILKERIEEFQKKSYAGFFIRGFALLIDWICIALLWEFSAHVLDWLSLIDLNSITTATNAFVEKYTEDPTVAGISEEFMNIPGISDLCLLWFVIQSVYVICFTGFLSATPGKIVLRLKIERADGHKLGFSGAIVRYVFSLLTQATLIFYGIGYILAMIDPQKRTLHDFFARTRVLNVRKKNTEDTVNEVSKD